MSTTFSHKDPSEVIFYGIDFSALLNTAETISSATASMRVLQGTDATPSAMLSGSPSISGGIVKHKIIGGVVGAVYLFGLSVITNAGQTFVESGPIKVLERD